MRSVTDSVKVRAFMSALGGSAVGVGRVYFTGGATAVLYYLMLLDQGRADAYSYYNSLIRALMSFSQSLERQRGAELRAAESLP